MNEFLPIGSVVLLAGGTQEMMIVSRAVMLEHNGRPLYYDYGGVLYPEGLTEGQVGYFQHENITQVVFEGYSNPANENMNLTIKTFLENHPDLHRGTLEDWTDDEQAEN